MIHTGISVISIHNSLCLLPLVPVVVFLPRLSSAHSFAHDAVCVQYTNCLRISLLRGGSLSNSPRPMYPSCQCTNIVLQDKPSTISTSIILTNCTFHGSSLPDHYYTSGCQLFSYTCHYIQKFAHVTCSCYTAGQLMIAWSHFTNKIAYPPARNLHECLGNQTMLVGLSDYTVLSLQALQPCATPSPGLQSGVFEGFD